MAAQRPFNTAHRHGILITMSDSHSLLAAAWATGDTTPLLVLADLFDERADPTTAELLRLTAAEDVSADVAAALGPVPPAARPAYELAEEMYGSSRMLLAALDAAQLAEVCSGWRRPMGEALEPLRAARPLHGGAGFDEQVVQELRMLNYELSAPEA